MFTPFRKQLTISLALADTLVLCGTFLVAFFLRERFPSTLWNYPFRPSLSSHIWMLILCAPMFWFLGGYFGLYTRLRNKSAMRLLISTLIVFVYLGLALGTAIFLFQTKTFSRAVFFMFFFLAPLATWIGRLALRAYLRRRRNRLGGDRRIIIVGTHPEAVRLGQRLCQPGDDRIDLVGHLLARNEQAPPYAEFTIIGSVDDLPTVVEQRVVDEVIFCVPLSELAELNDYIYWCEEVGVTVHIQANFIQTLIARTYPTIWEGIPMLTLSTTPREAVGLLAKRSMDLAISATALIVLSPLLLTVAVLIKLTSRGPVFFKQQRVGLNGRYFTFYKFRSMCVDAEQRKQSLESMNEMTGPVFKVKDDPRITPVGRWMRKLSIDELPQLWNVLKGQMSLVGPRPPVPSEVSRYERWQRRRLSMKPGITCIWQVNGRNEIGFDDWMKMDLEYIDNWSLRLDCKLLLRTIPAVLSTRGAR